MNQAEWGAMMDGIEADAHQILSELMQENRDLFFYGYGALAACKKLTTGFDVEVGYEHMGSFDELILETNEIKNRQALSFVKGAMFALVRIVKDQIEEQKLNKRERLKLVRAGRR